MSDRHLHRIDWAPRGPNPPDLDTWPYTIPAVSQLITDGGWDVPAGVTFLVGENGSGKSTLVEAFAAVYPRRGFETAAPVSGAKPQPEDSPLRWHLRAATHPLASPAGFFLRSETLRDHLRAADASPRPVHASDDVGLLVARSHGEAVLTLLRTHFTEPGVYFLDEPESGLSFTAMLGLIAVLDDMAQAGCQLIVATHSPLLTALPGSTLYELGDWGMRQTSWDQLELVAYWRDYLATPERFLRHLLARDPNPGP